MHKKGYLLIEIMVALALVTAGALTLAALHVNIVQWYAKAEQYLHATTIAQEALAYAQHGSAYTSPSSTFNVTHALSRPSVDLPFSLYTVTVSFTTINGGIQKIVLQGGLLHET